MWRIIAVIISKGGVVMGGLILLGIILYIGYLSDRNAELKK